MCKHQTGNDKEEQTFKTYADFKEVLHVLGDPTSLFDDFQNSKEACQFDQLVQSSQSRDSGEFVPILATLAVT